MPDTKKLIDDLRRIGASQAGALTTETGETWHPACLLLPAADELEAKERESDLAKRALDVMMRRGWGVQPVDISDMWWRAMKHGLEGDLVPVQFTPVWPNPFTALVEADAWYKANVEPPDA